MAERNYIIDIANAIAEAEENGDEGVSITIKFPHGNGSVSVTHSPIQNGSDKLVSEISGVENTLTNMLSQMQDYSAKVTQDTIASKQSEKECNGACELCDDCDCEFSECDIPESESREPTNAEIMAMLGNIALMISRHIHGIDMPSHADYQEAQEDNKESREVG